MRILALLLLLCTLTACSLAPNSYLSVTPHAGSSDRVTNTDAVTVSDYTQLKNAILNLVEAGQTEGSIRATNYKGDLERDLADAAYEVAKLEPLGTYAVDYMTHDCTLIVNYYEIDIRITFRRTAREIASIEHLVSQTLLRSRLERAVNQLEERVTVELRNYRETDIPAMIAEYCGKHPGTVMETPAVTVAAYPDSGSTRILEINLTYTEPVELLQEKQKAVEESIAAAAEYIRYRQTDREKAELLFTYMTERFTYAQKPTVTPVHDALCAGVAHAEGLAQALKLVCDRAGVDCLTVTGLRRGEDHVWNIISFDGEYRHVDLETDILEFGALRFLTDEEMQEYYWNQAEYPACIAAPEAAPEGQPPAGEAPPAVEAPPVEERPPAEEEPPAQEEWPPAEEVTPPEEGEPEPPVEETPPTGEDVPPQPEETPPAEEPAEP